MIRFNCFLILSWTVSFCPNGHPDTLFASVPVLSRDAISGLGIRYTYSDVTCPVLVFNRTPADPDTLEFEAAGLTRFTALNMSALKEKITDRNADGKHYLKRICRPIFSDSICIAFAARFDDQGVQRNYRGYDLLLFRRSGKNYIPVTIYPETMIGGCLYCGIDSVSFRNDTLLVSYSGYDAGDRWVSTLSLALSRIDFSFRLAKETTVHSDGFYETGGDNPVSGAASVVRWAFTYDEDENRTVRSVTYDSRYRDGRPVFLFAKRDTLPLYDVRRGRLDRPPVHLRTVHVDGDSIRCGPIREGMIPVFIGGEWYLTQVENIHVPDRSAVRGRTVRFPAQMPGRRQP